MADYTKMAAVTTLATKELTALLRTTWRKKIEYLKLKQDPLVGSLSTSLYGTLDLGKQADKSKMYAIPNKIVQDLTPEFDDEAHYAREFVLTLSMPFTGEGHLGTTDALGHEEESTWKYAKVYSNDVGHASTMNEYGITARETIPMHVQNDIQAKLATWRAERQGYDMRFAIMYRVSPNLLIAPFSLTQTWNPHTYIVGEPLGDQAPYSADTTTYNNAVTDALNNATTSNNLFDLTNLLSMKQWAEDSYINPIMYEGMDIYVLYISSTQMLRLQDPATTNGWGSYIKDVAAIPKYDIRKIIPGASFIIGDSVVVCEDKRTARIGITGSTITPYFMKMGRTDERASALTETRAFDVNLLLGQNALAKVTAQQWQFKFELQNYEKYKGVDYNGAESWQIPIYDIDTPTDSSVISEGSAVIFTYTS